MGLIIEEKLPEKTHFISFSPQIIAKTKEKFEITCKELNFFHVVSQSSWKISMLIREAAKKKVPQLSGHHNFFIASKTIFP